MEETLTNLKILAAILGIASVGIFSGCDNNESDSSQSAKPATQKAAGTEKEESKPTADVRGIYEFALKFCKDRGIKAIAGAYGSDPNDIDATAKAYAAGADNWS